MTNRLTTILLVLLTTALLLWEAGHSFMTPRDRWQEWLQLLTAQQVSDTLDRQVQIGPITDLSLEGVETSSLAVAEDELLADGAILRAERLRIAFDLMGMVRGDVAPAAGIEKVRIERAWVHLVRDPEGALNLQKVLPEPGPPAPPEERFQGIISIADSTIIYDDYAVPVARGSGLNAELVAVNAEVDMRRVGWADVTFSARDRLGRIGSIQVTGTTELDTGYAWASADVGAIDAAYWFDRLVATDEVSVRRGRVDVSATVGLLPREDRDPEPSVSGEVAINDAAVTVAALDGREVRANANATVTMDGARVHRLTARMGGTLIEASGFVGDFADPVLDVAFDADLPRPKDIVEIVRELVPQVRDHVDPVSISGPLTISGELTGSVAEANVSAQVAAPGQVRYASADAGEFVAGPIDLRVDLLDLTEPSVRARADVQRAEAVDLQPVRDMLPQDLEGPLEVAPLENLRADVLWAMETPLAQTEITLPRAAVGDLVVEDLYANVAMSGDIVRLSDIRARPLGATLTADGVMDLAAEDGPWAWARGEIDGLDLARLRDLPGLDVAEDVSGTFSGQFAGELDAGAPFVVAKALLDRPQYGQYGVESLQGLVTVDDEAVRVSGASFQDAMASGWVRGAMPFEGEMAASFGIAGVDLATVAERFEVDVEGLSGEAFVTGSASGSTEDPRIDATVRAFNVNAQGYEVDAVRAGVRGGMKEVTVDDLYASSGRIVAHVDGELSGIDFDTGDADLAGTVVLSGPVDRRALDLMEMSEEDLAGAVRATFDVGGTIKRPSASGEVHLDYARYETIATDDAVLTASLQGDVLELSELRVPVGNARISGEASISSLYDTPIVSANVRAEDVVLQDLALWQDFGLPLSGQVSLPYISLQGPIDALKGMAQIDASDLELGDEPIGAISAICVLDENALMLRRTSLALAGGTLALEGQYRIDEKRIMPSRVELEDVSIQKLLRAAVPLARRFGDAPPEERVEDELTVSEQLASLSMRLSGRMDGSVAVEGAIPPAPQEDQSSEETMEAFLEALSGQVEVTVREPAFDNKTLPQTMLLAEVGEDAVNVNVEASQGDGLITVAGSWWPGGELQALTEVTSLDLASLRQWMPAVVRSTGGQLNVTVQAMGSLEAPEVIGSVDIIEPETRGVKFDLVSAPIIRYDGEVLNVDSLVLREGKEELFVDGLIPFDWETRSLPPDGELKVTARSDGTDLGIFPPLIAEAMSAGEGESSPLNEITATGTLDTLVSITGTPRRPELNGELKINAPSISTPWLTSPIEDGTLTATFQGVEGNTLVALEELSGRYESLSAEAGGRAELSAYEMDSLTENTYDFTLNVSGPKQTVGSDGLTARDVRGEVTLATSDGGDQIVTVSDLGADFGDGSILMNGTVGLRSFEFAKLAENDFDLSIVADGARPRYANLFLGTVDGDISMTSPSPEDPVMIAGSMMLSHAVLGLPRPSGEKGGELKAMSLSFPAPQFDVRLAIGPDVRVKTVGVVAPLEPTERAIVAQGTPQRPTVRGEVEVQEGEASMPGGAVDIQTAGVSFLVRPSLGSRRQKPPIDLDMDGRIWATATRSIDSTVVDGREVGPVDIHLQVSGTLPDNIHVDVSSTPPLAEEQIYALLGTAPFSGGSQLAQGGDLEQVMTEQFVSALGAAFRHYVFQPFQEELKQLLGLSVFEVSFAFDQPVAVRVGGYVVEDILVTYETSVMGSAEEYDLGVSYKVQRRFEVSYRTDETNDQQIFIEYVYRF